MGGREGIPDSWAWAGALQSSSLPGAPPRHPQLPCGSLPGNKGQLVRLRSPLSPPCLRARVPHKNKSRGSQSLSIQRAPPALLEAPRVLCIGVRQRAGKVGLPGLLLGASQATQGPGPCCAAGKGNPSLEGSTGPLLPLLMQAGRFLACISGTGCSPSQLQPLNPVCQGQTLS